MDGFRAVVVIDEVAIEIGRYRGDPRRNIRIEMTGTIRQCFDANFEATLTKQGHRNLKTYAKVIIDSSNPVEMNPELKNNAQSCIGNLRVKRYDSRQLTHHPDPFDIRAVISLAMEFDEARSFLFLKNESLLVEPIFFRPIGEQEKKTTLSDLDGIISYIERVHFSSIFETRPDYIISQQ